MGAFDSVCCACLQEWQAAGVEQLRLSTVDLTGVPSLENLHRGVEFALQHRQEGTSVYVHCKAGRSRSATLAAAYLIRVGRRHAQLTVPSLFGRLSFLEGEEGIRTHSTLIMCLFKDQD